MESYNRRHQNQKLETILRQYIPVDAGGEPGLFGRDKKGIIPCKGNPFGLRPEIFNHAEFDVLASKQVALINPVEIPDVRNIICIPDQNHSFCIPAYISPGYQAPHRE